MGTNFKEDVQDTVGNSLAVLAKLSYHLKICPPKTIQNVFTLIHGSLMRMEYAHFNHYENVAVQVLL